MHHWGIIHQCFWLGPTACHWLLLWTRYLGLFSGKFTLLLGAVVKMATLTCALESGACSCRQFLETSLYLHEQLTFSFEIGCALIALIQTMYFYVGALLTIFRSPSCGSLFSEDEFVTNVFCKYGGKIIPMEVTRGISILIPKQLLQRHSLLV